MMWLRRLGGPLVLVLMLAEPACSASEDAASADPGSACYYGCGDGSAGSAGWAGEAGGALADAAADAPWVSPLCGRGSCDPDFEQACSPGAPLDAGSAGKDARDAAADDAPMGAPLDAAGEDDDAAPAESIDASPDDDASAAGDASTGDDASSGEPASPAEEGDASDASLADDAADMMDASSGADPGDAPPAAEAGAPPNPATPMACHVRPTGSGPASMCEPAGMGAAGAACTFSSDCAPGLGCVGDSSLGMCLPYCCGDPENCPSATYCAPRPSHDDVTSANPIRVPVCVPVTSCTLLEPAPCADDGLACSIVRADGTTSCVTPGEGRLGEACPCASGFVCAKSANRCLKLCHTGRGSTECSGGTCQGGTGGLPAGFGVCVGGVQDAG